MIDSHCHLTDPRLASQLPAVLMRAKDAGVEAMVTIGTNPIDDAAAITLCETLADSQKTLGLTVRCTVGIHPNYCQDYTVDDVANLAIWAPHSAVVALGEMGLDYHYDYAEKSHQKIIFEKQLDLAVTHEMPVVIHCRDAVEDTLAMMKNYPTVRAVFHCFTGQVHEAAKIIEAGYYLGFTGPITYKKNFALREAVKNTPLDRILIETDAPYLSPEPMRSQKVNEPSLVQFVLQTIASTKELLKSQVNDATAANTKRLYRW